MGARSLETRLTARLLALAGTVLVAAGVAAVVVTDRMLDASDTGMARAHAKSALDALGRELAEGDATEQAIHEVVEAEEAEGVRVEVRSNGPAMDRGAAMLAEGACATTVDADGKPWRACADGNERLRVVAAIRIGEHRGAVKALSRGMLAVVAVALLALWVGVRRAIRAPVAELTALVEWTARIVESERAIEPPPTRTRETAQLEAAFDALVRRLLDALARERANSAHIAHELRTPLTAIVAELDGIRAEDETARGALARVRGDVARLADVIDAILVLSDGRRERVREEAVVNVADVARGLAPEGAIVEAPDEALVDGDERLVSLAVRNLVDNARKYGAGARMIRVSREGTCVRLAIVDEGPGLDDAARGRMFDRYWRGSADGDGRGLGLALVRAVAERHGGRAEARPRTEGSGLEVSMTLGGVVGWHE
jgi:two-component system sensor histidine kinase QseC